MQSIIELSKNSIFGKEDRVKLALTCILAQGHLLIEDLPGVGKTTLVKFLARAMNLSFSRIQFTNDLLPFDIIGSSFFNKDLNEFVFRKGPIFGEVILADELNRAPAKTQSALLQVMEEKQISVEDQHFEMDFPFIVIATQNPKSQIGTFDLPESQLDRFMMKIDLGYPDRQAAKALLLNGDSNQNISEITPVIDKSILEKTIKDVKNIKVSDDIIHYILDILDYSRTQSTLTPLSNRAGIDLTNAAKAWAFLDQRDYVIPSDVQTIFPYVASHRIFNQEQSFKNALAQANELIKKVPVI